MSWRRCVNSATESVKFCNGVRVTALVYNTDAFGRRHDGQHRLDHHDRCQSNTHLQTHHDVRFAQRERMASSC
jgi:hypothetical protein